MEKILCAATWYKELPMVKPEIAHMGNPKNVDKGIVLCGWRHTGPLYQKAAITGLPDSESGEFEQGFLTSENRFVDRYEAAKIAWQAGQLKEQIYNRLHSEDLY